MNSKTLNDKFRHIYKDFFLKNNLVISVPNVIHWGHVFSNEDTDIKIQQKIPTKMFLGVSVNNTSNTSLGNISYFCKRSQKYITVPLGSVISNADIGYLEEIVQNQFRELGYDKGININILSENERGNGIDFSGVISVLLICALYQLQGKLSQGQLENHKEFTTSILFQEIYSQSVFLYQKLCLVHNSLTPYTAMNTSWLPAVQFKNTNTKLIDTVKSDCKTMDTLFNLDQVFNKPTIDYGIVSYGGLYTDCYSSISYDKINKEYQDNMEYLQQYISVDKIDMSNVTKNILNYLNIKLIKSWEKLLKNPYNESIEDDLISVVSEHGVFNSFLEKEKKIHTDTLFLFDQNKTLIDEKIGLTSISSGKTGGCFLFVTNYKKSRETMDKLLLALQSSGYPNAGFEYLSWVDGVSSDGLKIEQHIDQKIYSSYISEDDIIFEDTYGQKYIGNHEKIITREKDILIFDTIHNKVYFNGATLTANDLRSQSATVDIMHTIFKKLGSSVKNSNFPVSSYSKNKNEMLGKIILPLQEFIMNNFQEKLDLQCSGGLCDFYITLNKSNVNLGFIFPLFQAS